MNIVLIFALQFSIPYQSDCLLQRGLPDHADINELIRNPANSILYYNYKAALDFAGINRVTLMHYISAGRPPIDSVAIYLTIEVLP